VLGALVRAHEAGLACPDWPLCFGELVPRFDLKVAFEYGHRVTAGAVARLRSPPRSRRRAATRRATRAARPGGGAVAGRSCSAVTAGTCWYWS
jgi:hypothetical protein